MQTRIADFAVSSDKVDADHDEVTFTGRVLTDEATPRPVADALVSVSCVSDCEQYGNVGKVRAGADGRFVLTGRLESGGRYNAHFIPGNREYDDTWSSLVKVTAGPKAPVTLTLDPLPATAVDYGAKIPFTGQVRRQDGRPVTGINIALGECRPSRICSVYTVRTGADGHFRADLPARESARVDASVSNALYTTGSKDDPAVSYSVRYETRVSDMNVRVQQQASGWVEADIRVQRKTAKWEPFPRVYNAVALYFRPKGGTTWTRRNGCPLAGADGWIRGCVATSPGDGDWQARVALTDETRPSVSAVRHLTMRYPTLVAAFDASPEPVRKGAKVKLSGYLKWMPPHGSPKPLAKRKVALYFQARGSRKWTYLGSGTTGAYGDFRMRSTAKRDGTWRVVFAGDGRLFGASANDYVDVR